MAEFLHQAGVPDWQVEGLLEDYAHSRRGEAAIVAAGVEDATGSPPHRFDDFARDYASHFIG
jgi:hypothetical protein